ncbi:MAG: 3'(2'),5'-bisphosphate nucleotidase [Calditrichaeota bacterium]|nr:3'(2'),5'-bisphosphate nucleotidase [Calditrichota bacterium]
MNLQRELDVAIQAVTQAAQLCENVRDSLVTADTAIKKDRSPVTIADYGAQALIIHTLRQAFPADPIVAEEDAEDLRTAQGSELLAKVVDKVQEVAPGLDKASILDAIDSGKHTGGSSGRFWTLDPIDGTKGFLRGDQYAIALALIEEGSIVLGALACPRLPENLGKPDSPAGQVFFAVRGEGAAVRPLRGGAQTNVRVSTTSSPTAAVFCESVESGHSSHSHSARIVSELGVQAAPLRIDSQAKYAAVARGDADVYLRLPTRADYEEKIWDHAAGWIVVQEAGGKVTDVHGNPLDFSLGRTLKANKGVIATNGRLHDPVLSAVRAVLG